MNLKNIKENKWFKVFGNIYVIILTIFVIWMVFFDTNSYFIHKQLNEEIEKLEKQKQHLEEEIEQDKQMIKTLKTAEGLEKYAREKYYMKKENEEIYLIEDTDSINKKEDE
ncbi:FtsB family cell division protein [Leptobacterium sp. I13]|uniref:FtsB family cell division protein n=1 Tax=Leptobacterium meishanense TaxID=3128904 RepID=UPI0030ECC5BF